jgi:hypothetical protein
VTLPDPGIQAVSQELIEELMGTVVAVNFVLQTLMDLPADVLPDEDKAKGIRELLTESASHEVEAVGEETCRAIGGLDLSLGRLPPNFKYRVGIVSHPPRQLTPAGREELALSRRRNEGSTPPIRHRGARRPAWLRFTPPILHGSSSRHRV